MNEYQDLYSVLGVAPSASPAQIAHAFRVQVHRYHPDTRSDVDSADHDHALRQILAAHEILRDPQRRASYDRSRTPRQSPIRNNDRSGPPRQFPPVPTRAVVVLGHLDSPAAVRPAWISTPERATSWETAHALLELLRTLDDRPW